MSERVAVLGVGVTKFEREPSRKMDEMAREAALLALDDAGMRYRDIQAGFLGNCYRSGMAPLVYYTLAKTGIPVTRVDIACASATRSIELAGYMIRSGAYDTCMVLGVEMMPKGMVPWPVDPEYLSTDSDMLVDTMMGLVTMPGAYAYKAVRYMHLYGAKPEHFARVSVKNHRNSCLNPQAMYQKEVRIEDVISSRMVCYPLTLFQCCANSNGAAAVILASEKEAKRRTADPVYLTGWGEASAKFSFDDPVESSVSDGDTASAARKAYQESGVRPEDVDVVQVHDAFTTGEILQIEALGLCAQGEGAVFSYEGNTDIGGKVPVNTDGGLIGCGHPVGATGCRMVCETYRQLKGQAGKRQVEGAKVGLVQNSGLGASNVLVLQA